jgi:hypothetical protein
MASVPVLGLSSKTLAESGAAAPLELFLQNLQGIPLASGSQRGLLGPGGGIGQSQKSRIGFLEDLLDLAYFQLCQLRKSPDPGFQ